MIQKIGKDKIRVETLWTGIYCVLMFLVFPLYFQNNYIDILDAKTKFFLWATVIYCVGAVLLRAYGMVRGRMAPDVKGKKNPEVLFTLWLLAGILIPLLLSDNRKTILWAYDGKQFGAVILLLCLAVYWLIGKTFSWNEILIRSICVGAGIVFILAFLNRYGIDPLGMYENLVENQRDEFLSTIGQMNVLSGYVSIFLPFFMGMFWKAKDRWEKMLFGFMIFFGTMAGVCSNSDSFFVVIVLCMVVYLWFSLDFAEGIVTFAGMVLSVSLGMLFLQFVGGQIPFHASWRSVQKAVVQKIPWAVVCIILALLWMILKKRQVTVDNLKTKKVILVLLGVIAVAGIVLILYQNVTAKPGQTGMLLFNDAWGTNRGYVWKRTIELYGDLPLHQKLFGVGLGGFSKFFYPYYEESIALFGYYFTDAHNEFLQIMVTTGLVGVIGYIGLIVTTIVKCLKERKRMQIVIASVVVAYVLQAVFNNPLVFTTPYLFLFMGISNAACSSSEEQEETTICDGKTEIKKDTPHKRKKKTKQNRI